MQSSVRRSSPCITIELLRLFWWGLPLCNFLTSPRGRWKPLSPRLRFATPSSKRWVRANVHTIHGGNACLYAKRHLFCTFLRFFAAFLCIFSCQNGFAEFHRIVQEMRTKRFYARLPFSYTPFCVSPEKGPAKAEKPAQLQQNSSRLTFVPGRKHQKWQLRITATFCCNGPSYGPALLWISRVL